MMSPISDIDVIRACNEVDLLMIPGAMTPTEVHTAYNVAKAKAVKIFPANICGERHIQLPSLLFVSFLFPLSPAQPSDPLNQNTLTTKFAYF